jgi:hypothetical protein
MICHYNRPSLCVCPIDLLDALPDLDLEYLVGIFTRFPFFSSLNKLTKRGREDIHGSCWNWQDPANMMDFVALVLLAHLVQQSLDNSSIRESFRMSGVVATRRRSDVTKENSHTTAVSLDRLFDHSSAVQLVVVVL